MGRTLPTISIVIQKEQDAFSGFRRALRRSDQIIFDELFSAARRHQAPISMAAHALPFESILLAMLLEQRKELALLRHELEILRASRREKGDGLN